MKRPFGVIGFSMLATYFLITNISFKMAVALSVGAMVIFLIFLLIKPLRKYDFIRFIALATAVFITVFNSAQLGYKTASAEVVEGKEITGVVCSTPTETDYAHTYIVKPDGENYKIRYVSRSNRMFKEGDVVTGKVVAGETEYDEDFFESSLSSRVYFTFYEADGSRLDKTGQVKITYSMLGKVKNWFSSVVDEYLPNENGEIVKAMTIGDKSELTPYTLNCFNYSGTAHLLVISGLHLTLWSLGLLRLLDKTAALRKLSVPLGFFCLFFYSALTGFSVSVLRAGVMVGIVILGKLFGRNADSINSVGLAVTVILLLNPFAVMSAAFWFTVLSTLGILVLAQRLIMWMNERVTKYKLFGNRLFRTLLSSVAVSTSATLFTLPVFLIKFRILPIATALSNIIMVDIAMVLMVLSVVGVIFHSLQLIPLAQGVFLVCGAAGEFLKFFTEKIGMSKWSTISVDYEHFSYFLIIVAVCGLVFAVSGRAFRFLAKPISVLLALTFIFIAVGCNAYDYNTPSVNFTISDETPVIVVNAHGESVVIGAPKKKNVRLVMEMMNSHNNKSPHILLVTDNKTAFANLTNMYSFFGDFETVFTNKALVGFEDCKGGVKSISMGDRVKILCNNTDDFVQISSGNRHILFLNCENNQKHFKNASEYDTIILYGKNTDEVFDSLTDCGARVLVPDEGKMMFVYLD